MSRAATDRRTPPDESDALAAEGLRLHQAGRLAEAEQMYRRILEIDPGHGDANNLLGVLAAGEGNGEGAVERISRAIARTPDTAVYHFNLASALHGLGRFGEAIDACRRAVALAPDFSEAHFGLATALKDQGRLEDAVAGYRRLLDLKPDAFTTHNDLGFVLQELGRTDDAVACFKRAIEINPDHAPAHGNLARAYLKQGLAEAALGANRRALDLDPSLIEAHNNRGNALRELGRLDEALAGYERAIDLAPDNADAHGNRGNCLHVLGRPDDAVAALRKAIEIKPDGAELHGNLGAVHQKAGRLEDAVACYRRAIALKPDCAVAWNNVKAAIMAARYDGGRLSESRDHCLDRLAESARTAGEIAMVDYYLASFRPHEADEAYHAALAGLPPRRDAVIPIGGSSREPASAPDDIIALLHFGRSGTGLLHSLIDGHPQISTLPSIYLRGYFNRNVWPTLSADGWRALPDRFAALFDVLFDAASAAMTPGALDEKKPHLGVREGMTRLGEARDETLTLDVKKFRAAALEALGGLGEVDPLSFLEIVHGAYEETLGNRDAKRAMFYHIHNPDDFTKLNFLRYAPCARLLVMVREPLQCCESWISAPFADNDYDTVAGSIAKMLFAVDDVPLRVHDSVGVRLEDLKRRPEATLRALCRWMGVDEAASLYEMTAQGKKWWGDPSSPDYGDGGCPAPFDETALKRPVGAIFSARDRLVLGALFYPFRRRFAYCEADPQAFAADLKRIRPMLDRMFDFEIAMADAAAMDHGVFRRGGAYRLLRAGLLERWSVLDEFSDYPHMLKPLKLATT